MKKEEFLAGIKDMVLMLAGPNIKEPILRERWAKKVINLENESAKLSTKDVAWISKEFKVWHKVMIEPKIKKLERKVMGIQGKIQLIKDNPLLT